MKKKKKKPAGLWRHNQGGFAKHSYRALTAQLLGIKLKKSLINMIFIYFK